MGECTGDGGGVDGGAGGGRLRRPPCFGAGGSGGAFLRGSRRCDAMPFSGLTVTPWKLGGRKAVVLPVTVGAPPLWSEKSTRRDSHWPAHAPHSPER